MNYWLMKSEPDVYGISDLADDTTTIWDGVRNYQARNFLREMQPGDLAFFYHSNAKPPGIVGLMKIETSGIDDPTQFDASSHYYDPKSKPEAPRWQTVTVAFVREFTEMITLDELRHTCSPDDLWVVRRGNRLSVMPVPEAIAQKILAMPQAQPSA
jgi:predicted RNA-binding protein with PUA-like domain